MSDPSQPEEHIVPPVWADAYNAWVDQDAHDGPNAPTMITLPAVMLPPYVVRMILRLFDPDGEF